MKESVEAISVIKYDLLLFSFLPSTVEMNFFLRIVGIVGRLCIVDVLLCARAWAHLGGFRGFLFKWKSTATTLE